jgi:hypothetical protein
MANLFFRALVIIPPPQSLSTGKTCHALISKQGAKGIGFESEESQIVGLREEAGRIDNERACSCNGWS